MDCRATKFLYVDRICIFVSLKCACKVRIMERGRHYRIGEDFEHCTILFSSSYYPSTKSSPRIAEDCGRIYDCNVIVRIELYCL